MARRSILSIGAVLAASAVFVAWRTRRAEQENPPLGRFVEVDGVSLHYIEEGSGEPLVLLHGNGSMIQDFLTSGLVRLAAHTHRVIVFDRPGYGWSTRPRGRIWTPAAQADLIAAAARKLGAERVHLFGHSWGTLIAVEWALRHPRGVRSLTLASGYYYPTARIDAFLAAGPAVPVLGDLMRFTITPIVGRLVWPMLLRKIFGPSSVPTHFEAFPRGIALSPLPLRASAEEAALMVPSAQRLQGRYRDLEPPPVILAGGGDRIVDTGAQSQRLHRAVPASRLRVFPDVGHMVHHIEPRAVAEAIAATSGPHR